MFFKICVVEIYWKTPVLEPVFDKVAGLVCNFIKKGAPVQVFSYEFCEISRANFFKEHLRAAASSFLTVSKLARMLQVLA